MGRRRVQVRKVAAVRRAANMNKKGIKMASKKSSGDEPEWLATESTPLTAESFLAAVERVSNNAPKLSRLPDVSPKDWPFVEQFLRGEAP